MNEAALTTKFSFIRRSHEKKIQRISNIDRKNLESEYLIFNNKSFIRKIHLCRDKKLIFTRLRATHKLLKFMYYICKITAQRISS